MLNKFSWILKTRMALVAFVLVGLSACGGLNRDQVAGETNGGGVGTGDTGISSTPADLTPGDSNSLAQSALTPGSVEDFDVNVGSTVYFDVDRSTLNENARQVLEAQAAWLSLYPSITITIEGHTDERGTREYNLALGDRRAIAARDYLVLLGVDVSRVLVLSYGEERPADPAGNQRAWALNRRAVTVINVVN